MPPTSENICPVCGWRLSRDPRSRDDATRFDCHRCGIFIFDRAALEDLPSILRTDRQRAALSYSIRRAQKNGQAPRPLFDHIERIVQSAFLPSPHEQADNLIRWIGLTVDGPGVDIPLNFRDHGAIAGSLLDFTTFRYLITELLKSGLLEGKFGSFTYDKPGGGTTRQSDGTARVTLSFAGWSRYPRRTPASRWRRSSPDRPLCPTGWWRIATRGYWRSATYAQPRKLSKKSISVNQPEYSFPAVDSSNIT